MLTIVIASYAGLLTSHRVPDSLSYETYPLGDWTTALQQIRTPGYPIFLAAVRKVDHEFQWLSLVQIALMVGAAFYLWTELAAWEMSRISRWTVAATIVFGCTSTDHISTVATDAPAAALGVCTAAALLHWARASSSFRNWITLVTWVTVTWLFRPAYLFLVPWVGLGGFLLKLHTGTSRRQSLALAGGVSLAVSTVLILWMSLRWLTVDDFSVVPFGSQNLAGVLVQLVSPEELAQVSEEHTELTSAINQHRQDWMDRNHWHSASIRAYMSWENRWDDVTWHIVVPAARSIYGDRPTDSQSALMGLNRKIVQRYPLRYATWLAKAARRSVWCVAADILMHPLFLVATLLVMLQLLVRAVLQYPLRPVLFPRGVQPLIIVALTYAACKIGFVILTSPPIGRFADAAAIFLPGVWCVIAVEWCLPEKHKLSCN